MLANAPIWLIILLAPPIPMVIVGILHFLVWVPLRIKNGPKRSVYISKYHYDKKIIDPEPEWLKSFWAPIHFATFLYFIFAFLFGSVIFY